jgi:hypothetical protein
MYIVDLKQFQVIHQPDCEESPLSFSTYVYMLGPDCRLWYSCNGKEPRPFFSDSGECVW